MKKLVFLSFCLLASLICFAQAPAEQLFNRLQKLQEKGVMFGQQDAPFYGFSWTNISKDGVTNPDKCDIKDVCGDLPAVMGFDLGGLEYFSLKNIDGVPFDYERKEIIKHYERGGIITLSWHPINPANHQNAWNIEGSPVAKILPGGELNGKFNMWLDEIVKFIKTLKDSRGNPIPLIFRPWHEMNGGWFWWGSKACTPEQYRQLFRYTYHYMQAKGDFCNLLWAYSPNLGNKSVEDYMRFYPGDFIKILGADCYQYSPKKDFIDGTRAEISYMNEVAQKTGHIIALTEFGFKNCDDAKWYTTSIWPAIQGYKLSHILVWRNAFGDASEAFGPYPGKIEEKDFVKFIKKPEVLILSDIIKVGSIN
ncbi:MAG: beta-mannosidase [Bacteroidaceae bacterium]|nr:beta-mannosidase [Bacteroidaceae bacterium]